MCITPSAKLKSYDAPSPGPAAPSQVNTSPFQDGWIIKVKMSNKGELGSLLDADAYSKECEH